MIGSRKSRKTERRPVTRRRWEGIRKLGELKLLGQSVHGDSISKKTETSSRNCPPERPHRYIHSRAGRRRRWGGRSADVEPVRMSKKRNRPPWAEEDGIGRPRSIGARQEPTLFKKYINMLHRMLVFSKPPYFDMNRNILFSSSVLATNFFLFSIYLFQGCYFHNVKWTMSWSYKFRMTSFVCVRTSVRFNIFPNLNK